MNTAQKLLTRLRDAHDGASDYRLAKILNCSYQGIGRVKHGVHGFSDETLNKIAQELGENPMLLIANYHLDSQDYPSMNNIWKEMKRLAELEGIQKYQDVTPDNIGDVSGL